jgi:hypothetical protein
MKRALVGAFCLLINLPFLTQASSVMIPQLRAVSEPVIYEYLFWDVYSAQLFTLSGHYNETAPFALKLSYKLDLKGKAIAERSIAEMKKQGLSDGQKEEMWLQQLAAIIPDVRDGDEIVGQVNENGKSEFFFNGTLVGEVDDAEFSKCFFDIWLGAKTSEPKLRRALLGETKD